LLSRLLVLAVLRARAFVCSGRADEVCDCPCRSRAAGIPGKIETRQCPVHFPSIDALVHTEVKASPIRDVIDAPSFDALLAGARAGLARLCDGSGEIRFAMPAHTVTARKV
jgi:hypothetical protein